MSFYVAMDMQEKVELVPGCIVYIAPWQLDEAVASSGGRPARLFWALLSVFFNNHTLVQSSALESRCHPAIDPNIRDTCISK